MAERIKRAAALGIFDGVHLGHRAVIERAVKLAESGLVPVVFTFKSCTVKQKQGRSLEYIYTDENKERIISSLGIRDIFSRELSDIKSMTGEEFVSQILAEQLNVGCVVCGSDFRFGCNASCGADELTRLGERYGFEVIVVPEEQDDGCKISSGRIRELIKSGAMAEAERLMGEPYTIYGEVVSGAHLGRTIGFPTVNQLFGDGQLVPLNGVYASRTAVGGKIYASMTNIGIKPTVEYDGAPLAETYIIGYSGNLYGQKIAVSLCRFVRSERKFGSVDELRAQIESDAAACADLCR